MNKNCLDNMETKFSELKFELKDVSEMKNQMWSCELDINEDRFTANYKTQIKLQCLEINPNTVLSITLIKSEKPVGSLQISFATLFSESLQGKLERWYKLKSADYPKLQIKFFASLNLPEKTLKRLPSFTSSTRSKEQIPKCPYLQSLPDSENDSQLKDLWSQRNSCTNLIQFSIEPDSPGMPSQCPPIDSISAESLKQLGGLQLKHLVRGLCEEIIQLEKIAIKLPEVKLELREKVEARTKGEKDKQIELEQIKERWMENRLLALELLEKRKVAKVNLMEKQEGLRKFEAELDILKAYTGDLKREQLLAGVQKMQYEDCEKSKEELQGLLERSQKNKLEFEEKIRKFEAETKMKELRTSEEILEFKKENSLIQEKINGIQKEYKQAQDQNKALKTHLNSLKSQLSDTKLLNDSLSSSYSALSAKEELRDTLNTNISSFIKELEKETQSLHSKHSNLTSKKSNLMAQLQTLNKSLESCENDILDTQKSIFDNKAQKIANEQICCVRADLHQLQADLHIVQDFYNRTQQKVLPDLLNSSNLLSQECQKVLNKTELLENMIESIDKKEEEMQGLKSNIGQVQKRQVLHVPVKGDLVDQALAEFVNAKQVPVKFIRQDGGNYIFGTCKVYIKLENSKLLAKVRGGFMAIEEFVDIQTPIEVQRGLSPVSNISGLIRMNKERSPEALGRKVNSVFESFSRSPKKQ